MKKLLVINTRFYSKFKEGRKRRKKTHLPHSLHAGQLVCFHGHGGVACGSTSRMSAESGEASLTRGEKRYDDQVINKKHSARCRHKARVSISAQSAGLGRDELQHLIKKLQERSGSRWTPAEVTRDKPLWDLTDDPARWQRRVPSRQSAGTTHLGH